MFHVEQWPWEFTILAYALGKIARFGLKAWRRSCFKANKIETKSSKATRKLINCRSVVSGAFLRCFSDPNTAIQGCTGSDDYGLAEDFTV